MRRWYLQNRCSMMMALMLWALPLGAAPLPTSAPILKDAEQFDFANGLFHRGLYYMAVTEYQKLLERYPDSAHLAEAHFGMAEGFFFSEAYAQAIKAYEMYIQQKGALPQKSLALLRVGQSHYALNDYAKALVVFKDVPPNNLSEQDQQLLFFFLGKTYQGLDQKEKAREAYQKAADFKLPTTYTSYSWIALSALALEQEQYKKATMLLLNVGTAFDHKNIAALALYKQGEVQFLAKNYAASHALFIQVLSLYADQDVAQEALANAILSLANQKQYIPMLTLYEKHAKKLPLTVSLFEAQLTLAGAYLEEERYDEAFGQLDHILGIVGLTGDQRKQVLVKKAEGLVAAGKYAEVLDFIEGQQQVEEFHQGYAVLLMAEAHYGLKEFAKAATLYQTVVDTAGWVDYKDEALYGLAHARHALGQTQEAGKIFTQYFQQSKDSEKRQEALFNSILLAAQHEDFKQAIELSKKHLETFPVHARRATVMFMLGDFWQMTENFQKAQETFQFFVKDFAQHTRLNEVYFRLGYNWQRLEKFNNALEAYDHVVRQEKQEALFYGAQKNKAAIYITLGQPQKAAVLFKQIADEFDQNDLDMDTYLWLARWFLEQENFDDVLRILDKAEKRYAQEGPQQQTVAYFRAQAYQAQDKFSQAIAQYDMVLLGVLEGEYRGPALISKGICLRELKEYDEARFLLEGALKEAQDDVTLSMRARYELGVLAGAREDWEGAQKWYMLVAVLYQDQVYCPLALFKSGEIFERLGKKDAARKVYQEIVEEYAQSAQAASAQQRLVQLHEKN